MRPWTRYLSLFIATVLATLLGGCGPAAPTLDAGSDAPPDMLDANEAVDAPALDGGTDAPCTPRTFAADCDGDGTAAASPATTEACVVPSSAPPCGDRPGARWIPEAAGVDCDDTNAGATEELTFFSDCDGDGLSEAAAVSLDSCGVPTDDPSTCGLGEVADWTLSPPTGATDCDDHDRLAGEAPTWFVDCDEDGFAPQGLGMVERCEAPIEVPAPCGGAGGWTSREPVDAPYAADNGSTDCVDANADVRPDQAAYFVAPIAGLTTHTYDYDCNGADEREHTRSYTCSSTMTGPGMYTCMWPGVQGWVGLSPACGEPGTLGRGCTLIGPSLTTCRAAMSTDTTAACR